MNMLTASSAGQGDRDNDFTWTIEGELVWMQEPCARDERDPDGGCGCGRAFSGFSSHRATTTAVVRDLPLTADDVGVALSGYLDAAGYGSFEPAALRADVYELLSVAAYFPVGAIVGRRLNRVVQRGQIVARPFRVSGDL